MAAGLGLCGCGLVHQAGLTLLLRAVEPLSGNLVRKDCADSCTPTYGHQGQVSSGVQSTQCCQGDLCNERLYSAAPARTLLSSATLGLALALGLLASVAPSL